MTAIAQPPEGHTGARMLNIEVNAAPPVLTPKAARGLLQILQAAAARQDEEASDAA